MSSSTVAKLDSDTFLSILDIITSESPLFGNPRALTIVRAASQVCWTWRKLALASPWIWGRLIDLNVADHGDQSTKWLDEVVRRAGPAVPLWIYGDVQDPRPTKDSEEPRYSNSQLYFTRILGSWERIEKLSVNINSKNEKFLSDIRNHFVCRAPILRIFEVNFTRFFQKPLLHDTLEPGSAQSLFDDYAPSLRAIWTDGVAYKMDAPWLSTIRDIFSFPRNFGLNEILLTLQHTPLLKRMMVYDPNLFLQQVPPHDQTVSLPHLSSILMETTLPVMAQILDSVSPGKLSWLRISIDGYQRVGEIDPSLLTSLKQNLPMYITSCFTSNPFESTTVRFSISDTHLKFCNVIHSRTRGTLQHFDININGHWLAHPAYWQTITVCFLDIFTESLRRCPSFVKSVTEIHLQRAEYMIDEVFIFLASFQCVQKLQTHVNCVCSLFSWSCLDISELKADGNVPENVDVLFPELLTVCLGPVDNMCRSSSTNLKPFLKRRKDIGFPVARLDLTGCVRQSDYPQDLHDVVAIDGLEIVWKNSLESSEGCTISRHVCGTGNPEQLKSLLEIATVD